MIWKLVAALIATAPLFAQAAPEMPSEAVVELLAPVSTHFSQKGDMVSARFRSPAKLAGAFLEGEIRAVEPGTGKKGAILVIRLASLHTAEKTQPLSAALDQILNSKGDSAIDEDGNPVRIERGDPGNGSSFFHSPFARNRTSAAKGETSLIRLTAESPGIRFDVGSKWILSLLMNAIE